MLNGITFVVGSLLALRVFSPGTEVFPPPKNHHLQIQFDQDRERGRKPAKADMALPLNIVFFFSHSLTWTFVDGSSANRRYSNSRAQPR